MGRNQREDRVVADAAAELSGALVGAVAETVGQASAEPSRLVLADLLGGPGAEDELSTMTELMASLILIRWLSVAREAVDAEPGDPVEATLGWIRDELGPRFAARARYTAGPLRDPKAAGEIVRYKEALGPDFLPSIVWLLAGVVVVYGGGDVGWLRRLVGLA